MRELTCKIVREELKSSIIIQPGILNDQEKITEALKHYGKRFGLIADQHVASSYGVQIADSLKQAGFECHLFSFPSGESSKNRETKAHLEDQMFAQKLGKDTCLIAMGGGVSTDLGGFIAATYCRGIPLVIIPTSLLGMVDASIGGKTGVDIPAGKNMIGAIYQPKKIIIDPTALKTLPATELRNGAVEMIKHGLICSKNYFEKMKNQRQALLEADLTVAEELIFESCEIKKSIVEEDERESGKRHLLNFGHTIGHGLELLTHFSIPHGEAVALGILVESHLSHQLGHLSKDDLLEIKKIFTDYGLPLKLPATYTPEQVLAAMSLDKKSIHGKPRFVILEKIGVPCSFKGTFCSEVDETLIRHSIDWMNHDLCRH